MHQGEEEEERQVTFLQLGETRAHRSVLDAEKYAKMTKEEWMHMRTCSKTDMIVDDTDHTVDPSLVMTCKAKLKVWGEIMTQYNLKPGLHKFGTRGKDTAISKMTQLHVMDRWTAMDPFKLTREDRMKALSSLLFLKEKHTGTVKGRACINGAPQGCIFQRRRQRCLPCQLSPSSSRP
jgi:hypothetical protein